MLERFFGKLIGKRILDKLGIKEGTPMDTKKWYTSKTVWAAILTAVVGAIQPISTAFGHPVAIPTWLTDVLVGLGLYGLRTADKPIA